jgi:hypothetical protein
VSARELPNLATRHPFRSRGECLDVTAGARALEDAQIADSIGVGDISRDISIVSPPQSKCQTVKALVTNGPVIYELRIAHRQIAENVMFSFARQDGSIVE